MYFSMRIDLTKTVAVLLSMTLLISCDSDDGPDVQCDDPAAQNFDALAVSDTDCIYPSSIKPVTVIGQLSGSLEEISGLAIFQEELIGHNDRSNPATLFFINAGSGETESAISIAGIPNNDWEDIAQSADHMYIGDFGNNEGDRTNLGIHVVPLSALNPGGSNIANADGTIFFSYPNQSVFDVTEHNFDCEASFYHEGFIYLFTKHRTDRRTTMYRVPAETGTTHPAERLGSFEAGGRITGADINADGTIVALTGYRRSGNCFVWKLYDFEGADFLSGKKEQGILGPFSQFGQVESVVFKTDSQLFLANEVANEADVQQTLYFLQDF